MVCNPTLELTTLETRRDIKEVEVEVAMVAVEVEEV
jgi:hypothetical protein